MEAPFLSKSFFGCCGVCSLSIFVRSFVVLLMVTAYCVFRPYLVFRVPLSYFCGANFRFYFEVPSWFVDSFNEVSDVALIVSRAIFSGNSW